MESFWQIGFDDTVTNSMVEMSHQGLLPRHLLAAAARLSHSPLHRGPGTLAQGCSVSQICRPDADGSPPRSFVWYARTGPNSPFPLSCMAS